MYQYFHPQWLFASAADILALARSIHAIALFWCIDAELVYACAAGPVPNVRNSYVFIAYTLLCLQGSRDSRLACAPVQKNALMRVEKVGNRAS